MHMYTSFYRRISTMNELICSLISDFCYGFFLFQNVVVCVVSLGVESLFSFVFGCMELTNSGLIDELLISVGHSALGCSVAIDALYICKVGSMDEVCDVLLLRKFVPSSVIG